MHALSAIAGFFASSSTYDAYLQAVHSLNDGNSNHCHVVIGGLAKKCRRHIGYHHQC